MCLDASSISPAGQKAVEPCDLFEVINGAAVLHHIKLKTQMLAGALRLTLSEEGFLLGWRRTLMASHDRFPSKRLRSKSPPWLPDAGRSDVGAQRKITSK